MVKMKFTPEEKIQYARIRMQKQYPFFSYLAMHLNIQEDKRLESMGVDFKGNLYYNPEFVDSLTSEEMITVMSHEVLHLGLEHLLRQGNRSHRKWNVATDYAVNNILVENNLEMPEMSLYDEKYSDMSAEEIYSKLPGDENGNGPGECDQNCEDCEHNVSDLGGSGTGTVCTNPEQLRGFDEHIRGSSSTEEAVEKAREWKDRMNEAAEYARNQGTLPAGIEELVEGLYEEKVNWKTLLRQYIKRMVQFDYSWVRPAKKSESVGVYLPSVRKQHLDIAAAIDTSGSISQDEFKQFRSEIFAIARSYQNLNITVILHDADVQEVYTIGQKGRSNPEDIKLKGRGGTDHRPVFEYIDKERIDPAVLICLTDAYSSFPDSCNYPVLWLIPENSGGYGDIPFGRAIHIDIGD